MVKRKKLRTPALVARQTITVRFSEVDAMNVVWHGSYVLYLEDGRENFGKQYGGLGYDDFFNNGFVTPVVNLNIDYKQSLHRGDRIVLETRYIATDAAKIIFEYIVYRESDMAVMATAETTQVFVSLDGEMQYASPDFYTQWKEKWLNHE